MPMSSPQMTRMLGLRPAPAPAAADRGDGLRAGPRSAAVRALAREGGAFFAGTPAAAFLPGPALRAACPPAGVLFAAARAGAAPFFATAFDATAGDATAGDATVFEAAALLTAALAGAALREA